MYNFNFDFIFIESNNDLIIIDLIRIESTIHFYKN